MKRPQEALLAYLATLIAIVVLTLLAAAIVRFAPVEGEENIARLIGAIGFISAAVTGLIGVIGTFRPKGNDGGEQS
jgi:hypothetical protein